MMSTTTLTIDRGIDQPTNMWRRKLLHEAMQEVLAEKNCRSTTEIAYEINSRGLYVQRCGGQVSASQISARANKYRSLFVRDGDKICLA